MSGWPGRERWRAGILHLVSCVSDWYIISKGTYYLVYFIEGLLECGMPRQLALALAVVCASPVSFVT
eukprot:scaffold16118_cov174-Skeletonema_marinoi.AAC.1